MVSLCPSALLPVLMTRSSAVLSTHLLSMAMLLLPEYILHTAVAPPPSRFSRCCRMRLPWPPRSTPITRPVKLPPRGTSSPPLCGCERYCPCPAQSHKKEGEKWYTKENKKESTKSTLKTVAVPVAPAPASTNHKESANTDACETALVVLLSPLVAPLASVTHRAKGSASATLVLSAHTLAGTVPLFPMVASANTVGTSAEPMVLHSPGSPSGGDHTNKTT